MEENTGAASADNPDAAGDELLFDAVLHPNRSLGRTGFALLMAVLSAVCAIAGIVFYAIGAWPITGFFGLDVALLYVAFRANYRSGRLTETVRLTRARLTVRRTDAGGREQAWSFQPYWLRVEVEGTAAHEATVSLISHGRRLIVGAFLSPGERAEFGEALRDALARCRSLPAPIA